MGSKISASIAMKWNQQHNQEENCKNIEESLDVLLEGLFDETNGFIYISQNNQIFCPVGFEITPLEQLDAYEKLAKIKPDNQELWIILS